jgi:AcrR family transcriptional regulator
MGSHARIPAEDRRLQILGVAGELFAAKGFDGTTTRELAEQAGINEALIFRHFPTKEELYWAVIQHMIDTRGTKERLRERLNAGLPDRETLVSVAQEILNRSVQLTRLLLYSALEKHELSDRFFKTHVVEYHEILADYIRAGIRQGRFRAMDPILAARSFIGMFSYHFQLSELFGGKQFQHFDSRDVVANLVDIWLLGMKPSKSGRKRVRRPERPLEKARQ